MRLLSTGPYDLGHEKLELIEKFGQDIPAYAILSHTWGQEEVLFEHVRSGTANNIEAYSKVLSAIRKASDDGFGYIWIDSCCIDKSSSAELSEAINSMYAWYQRAGKCYAILDDVSATDEEGFESKFRSSRWFTRGWTLQELLAPKVMEFFGKDTTGAWSLLGTRISLSRRIARITAIHINYLTMFQDVQDASVATRMSWAARRNTTREEDVAYCLLGLFGVSMPMLYGEGTQAFLRLQEEIIKVSDDQSIFAWTEPASDSALELSDSSSRFEDVDWPLDPEGSISGKETSNAVPKTGDVKGKGEDRLVHVLKHFQKHKNTAQLEAALKPRRGLLADSPAAFIHSGAIIRLTNMTEEQLPFQMTNRGLGISLQLLRPSIFANVRSAPVVALLECRLATGDREFIGIYLSRTQKKLNQYVRVRSRKLVKLHVEASGERSQLFVRQRPDETVTRLDQFCLLRDFRHGLHEYTAVKLVSLGTSTDEKPVDQDLYPSETSSARSWVPPESPTVFMMPSTPYTLIARIELQRRVDEARIEILIGTMANMSIGFVLFKTVRKPLNIHQHFSQYAQHAKPSSAKAETEDHRAHVEAHKCVDHGRLLYLVDLKIEDTRETMYGDLAEVEAEDEDTTLIPTDDAADIRLEQDRRAWHLFTRPEAY